MVSFERNLGQRRTNGSSNKNRYFVVRRSARIQTDRQKRFVHSTKRSTSRLNDNDDSAFVVRRRRHAPGRSKIQITGSSWSSVARDVRRDTGRTPGRRTGKKKNQSDGSGFSSSKSAYPLSSRGAPTTQMFRYEFVLRARRVT